MAKRSWEHAAILVLFLGALAFSLSVASKGWSHAISDIYGWRQAQTAISAYFIQQGGPWLGYETPVLGPPWSLPHEFPVYQLAVAGLATVTGLQLEPAGRAVSLAFFYALLVLAYLLLAEFHVAPRHRLLVVALWLVSPLYLFWSRTLMIESTALFLSFAFLTFAARFLERSRYRDALVALLAGGLAFAVKPPTVVLFAGLAGLWWFVLLRQRGYKLTLALLFGCLVIVLPLGVGWTWHRYADALKELNHFGWAWTSEAMWRDWVFSPIGTHAGLDRRFKWTSWWVIWGRTIPECVGHFAVVVAAVLGVVVARRRRVLFSLAVGAFLAHFALFTPLHLSHAYYQYGMGFFLVLAVGFAAVALLECEDARRYLAWPLVILMVILCVNSYATRMLPIQRRNAYRKPAWYVRLASDLTRVTRPGDVVVGFGLDWNPEVPYYAKRRALMWPGYGDSTPDSPDVAAALASLDGHAVGALFSCSPDTPEETLARFRDRLNLEATPSLRVHGMLRGRQCRVWLPASPRSARPPG